MGLSTESVPDWPSVMRGILNATKHADGVRYKILRDAQTIVHTADKLAREMQELGMDSREAMASAALTAGWRWWGVDNKEVLLPTGNIGADGRQRRACWKSCRCGIRRAASPYR